VTSIRLRYVADVNPATPAFGHLNDDEEVTFLPLEAVWPGTRLDLSHRRTKASVATGFTRFQNGDVLVPKITPTFEASRAVLIDGLHGGVGTGTTELHVLRAKPGTDARFLYYVVNTDICLKWGEAEMYGVAGQKRVPESFFSNMIINLPSLDEQRRIADFLDREICKIEQMQLLLEKQGKLLQERERAALTMGITGARLGEPTMHTGIPWMPSMHHNGQPVRLARLLQLQRGLDLTSEEQKPGEVVVVTTSGVAGMHSEAIDHGPGVVIGRYGSVGNVHWIEGPYWPHNTTLYVRNFYSSHRRYCYHLLRSLPYEMEQTRAAIPGVNRNDLHRQLVPLLPYDLQVRIAAQLDEEQKHYGQALTLSKKRRTLLTERKRALITAAVTGQIDVTTARGVEVT
jgi:type I restriction enzyme, S subunit